MHGAGRDDAKPSGTASQSRRFAVVALVVGLNLVSLPLVEQGAGTFRRPDDNFRASGRLPTDDVLELGEAEFNVWSTHNLFLVLDDVAPGAAITVLGVPDQLREGQRLRARFVGLVQPSSQRWVDVADPDLRAAVLSAVADQEHLVEEGTIYEIPSRARAERLGRPWEVHLAGDHADDLILVQAYDGSEGVLPTWVVLDASLLPNALLERIRP